MAGELTYRELRPRARLAAHVWSEGHGLELVGVVISLHIAGMFAPAPLTGRLTDRLGALPVAAAGTALLIVAGALAALAGGGAPAFAVGLGLLGVGWNAGLIAGSTLLASAAPSAQRPRAEAAALAPLLVIVARRGLPAGRAPAQRVLS